MNPKAKERSSTASSTLAWAFISSSLVISPLAVAEPANFTVDNEHFSMAFEIMHIGYAPVIGMFRKVEGQFVYDEEAKDSGWF